MATDILERCSHRIQWGDIDENYLRQLIKMAKEEDLEGYGLAFPPKTKGDISSALLDPKKNIAAHLRARESLVVCGAYLAELVIKAYSPDLKYEPLLPDGELAQDGDTIGRLSGPAVPALSAERPLLNFLQRLSGIATNTRQYVQSLQGIRTRLLDTRKTTPGYRVLEKYAVACGGGWNHRVGLFDRVMLKDNHLAAFGNDPAEAAKQAVANSRQKHPDLIVEMEVDSLEQIDIALQAKADVILLDNFAPLQLQQAVKQIERRVVTEASGGITLENLPAIAESGVDFASTGALVHHSRWIDIGLDWD